MKKSIFGTLLQLESVFLIITAAVSFFYNEKDLPLTVTALKIILLRSRPKAGESALLAQQKHHFFAAVL